MARSKKEGASLPADSVLSDQITETKEETSLYSDSVLSDQITETKVNKTKNHTLVFPKSIELSNYSPTSYVVAQLGITLHSGDKAIVASVFSADQLSEILLNIQTFNSLNGWDSPSTGILLNILE